MPTRQVFLTTAPRCRSYSRFIPCLLTLGWFSLWIHLPCNWNHHPTPEKAGKSQFPSTSKAKSTSQPSHPAFKQPNIIYITAWFLPTTHTKMGRTHLWGFWVKKINIRDLVVGEGVVKHKTNIPKMLQQHNIPWHLNWHLQSDNRLRGALSSTIPNKSACFPPFLIIPP